MAERTLRRTPTRTVTAAPSSGNNGMNGTGATNGNSAAPTLFHLLRSSRSTQVNHYRQGKRHSARPWRFALSAPRPLDRWSGNNLQVGKPSELRAIAEAPQALLEPIRRYCAFGGLRPNA